MATLAPSLHRIRNDEPRFFIERAHIFLQLQYRIDDDGEYEFGYRKVAQTAAANDGFVARGIEQLRRSLQEQERFGSSLDIRIKDRDTVVQVDTFGPHLSWSLIRDAVTTLDDHSDLYGELRYFDGSNWVRREDFGGRVCTRIRFKAKFNDGASDYERHKFSYNVRLRDPDGNFVEHEIDPDIKNPSV
ncbi:MAG TPA: nucleotide synthetase [Allosphingosinicella sp.]